MYTTNAYYPSPFDGNYYPAYIYLQDGQLTPIHFIHNQQDLKLVWFQPNAVGQAPIPRPVQVLINKGFSNLVYFQPQMYGNTQLLYCTSVSPQHLVLLMNTDFQQYAPVETFDSQIKYQPSHEVIPHGSYMEQNPNRALVNEGGCLPPQIIQALQAVQSGTLPFVNVNCNQFGFNLTAEDHKGNRYLLEMYSQNGITHKKESTIDNLNDKDLRQKQVQQLKAKKMTQIQIANHLGVSQKTISNDLKELGLS
jgi:hypothetical protein